MRLGGPSRHVRHQISGLFQPNATGRGELRSFAGLKERQLLKGCGQYVGERIRLAVTAHEITAWRVGPFDVPLGLIGAWDRTGVLAVRIAPCGVDDPTWPAFALLDLGKLEFVAELRALRDGAGEREVVRRLEAPRSVSSVKPS